MKALVSALALSVVLAGCAGMPPASRTSSPSEDEVMNAVPPADSDISVASLDPLEAAPPFVAPAPVVPANSPLLVPTPSQGPVSQRVPLGTLNASSDPAPAAKPPTALVPGATTLPAKSASTQVTAAKPVAAKPVTPTPAPVVAPPVVPPAPVLETPVEETRTPAVVLTPPPAVAPMQAPTVQAAAAQPPVPGVTPATPSRAQVQPAGATRPVPRALEDEETTIISSATTPPTAREFVPASVVPTVAPPAPPALGEMPFTQAERNISRRFETLDRLRDEALITQEEFSRRRSANLGALLPYSQEPAAVGLDRSVPSSDAIVARLGALRRSFEMRAITAQQHALERTMILNALLPERPEQRTNRRPPPADVIEGAAMVGHLEVLRENDIITQPELDAERRVIDSVLRTGLFPPTGGDAAKPAATAAKTTAKPAAGAAGSAASAGDTETPMTRPITGPVLHLASFRSEASALKGWEEVIGRNKAAVGNMKPIIRRVDLGEGKGIFYRLMMGSFSSMSDAEAACVKLKQGSQFCRASADGN